MITAVLALLAAPPAGATSYNPTIPFPSACGNCTMYGGEALRSAGGWSLNMQGDGNLVMRNAAGTACWASNTAGHTGSRVTYQGDGNFVVYSSGGTALWASNTVGAISPTYAVSVSYGNYYVGPKKIHGPC